MKDKIIILLSLLLILSISIIIILKNIIDDKTLLINGYKSDRNVCRMQKQEIEEEYHEIEKRCK
jgi:uncharacterized protein YxeA